MQSIFSIFTRQEQEKSAEAVDFYTTIKERISRCSRFLHTNQEKEKSAEAVDFYTTRNGRIRRGS